VAGMNLNLGLFSLLRTFLTQGWSPYSRWHHQSQCSNNIHFLKGRTKWGTLVWE